MLSGDHRFDPGSYGVRATVECSPWTSRSSSSTRSSGSLTAICLVMPAVCPVVIRRARRRTYSHRRAERTVTSAPE
jgi:hypothetical protein